MGLCVWIQEGWTWLKERALIPPRREQSTRLGTWHTFTRLLYLPQSPHIIRPSYWYQRTCHDLWTMRRLSTRWTKWYAQSNIVPTGFHKQCFVASIGELTPSVFIPAGCVHQARRTGEGKRDQGEGRWGVCDWKSTLPVHTFVSVYRDVTTAVQARLVKQAQQNIDIQFEKKRKGAEVAQKMYV